MTDEALQEPLLGPVPQRHAHPSAQPHHTRSTGNGEHTDAQPLPLPHLKLSFAAEARRVLGLALPITASSVLGFLAHLITTAQVSNKECSVTVRMSCVTVGTAWQIDAVDAGRYGRADAWTR